MNISEKIKYLTEKNNISMSEISSKTKIPNSTLSDIINGRTKNLSIQKAKLICDVIGCSLDYLLDGNDKSQNYTTLTIENSILEKYNFLDEKGKYLIDRLLDEEYKRCLKEYYDNDDIIIDDYLLKKVKAKTLEYPHKEA